MDRRPEAKARRRVYKQRPEVKAAIRAANKAYRQRPEVKAKRRAYKQRPEVKATRRAANKVYMQRPKVKAKRNARDQRLYKGRPCPQGHVRRYKSNWACKQCSKRSKRPYGQASRVWPGVKHGGGKAGKRDCPCAMCKAIRKRYLAKYSAVWRKNRADLKSVKHVKPIARRFGIQRRVDGVWTDINERYNTFASAEFAIEEQRRGYGYRVVVRNAKGKIVEA